MKFHVAVYDRAVTTRPLPTAPPPAAPPPAAPSPAGRWVGVDAPVFRRGRPAWRAFGWAALAVAAGTLVGRFLFGRIDETNLIIVYLLGILPVALRGDRGAAVAAALASVAAFDFFFTHPYLSFAVSDTQYVFTFAVMGLVGVVISSLTARLAAEISDARHREARARALYELSRALLGAREPGDVLLEGARVLGHELGRPVAAWRLGPDGDPVPIGPEPPLGPDGWARLRGVVGADGPAEQAPGGVFVFHAVRSTRGTHGAIGIQRLPHDPPAIADVQAMLATGANQIAIALEHELAREEADAARRLAEKEGLRSALLSSVSHDLRTPLAGIVGAASSLVDGAEAMPPELRRELAQGIVDEGERLNRLVTNLLQATRLDDGTAPLARTWFGLEEVLEPALGRLAAMLACHRVDLDLPADLPMAFGDPALFDLVFTNLLENAAKYTPPGTPIHVRAWATADRLWAEVRDEGPGLPLGAEEAIFEKYARAGRGDGAPGAGLGLPICRAAVRAHGGDLTGAPGPGGGAAFRLWVPRAPAPTARSDA